MTDKARLFRERSIIRRQTVRSRRLADKEEAEENGEELSTRKTMTKKKMLYAAEVISARTIQSWNAPRSTLGASKEKKGERRERERIKSAACYRDLRVIGPSRIRHRMSERMCTDGWMVWSGCRWKERKMDNGGGQKKGNAARKRQAERIRRISARR